MSGRAVVIGGGIGGLLAAHVLAGRFAHVTVLERDVYPADASSCAPPSRRGAPQSRCLHLLMAAGAAAFDQLVPGWREELVARGAVCFDASADTAMRYPGGWLPRTPSGITTYACSRALLEDVLRRGLARTVTLHLREGRKVLGLLGNAAGDCVTGVRTAGSDGSDEARHAADLVVDASGRGSSLPAWIAGLQHDPGPGVDETAVASTTQYVSRWFHLQPRDAPDWQCLSIAPAGARAPRSAMMLRAEGNCWGVVLLAPAGDALPRDDQAFLDFTASLADSALRDALARATPLSRIQHFGDASSRLRHYERRVVWPAGLVALGDSVCALDPYFGLGMTATARGVELLKRHLHDERAGPGLEFQKDLAALNIQPWQLATGHDTSGRPLARDEDHLRRVYEAAPSRPDVARALLAVQHLLSPTESLMELQTV